MNNIIKISLIVAMICLLFTLNVYATETSVNIASRVTECKVGDTFEVVISFKCEDDFKGLTGILEYDNTKLKLEEAVSNGYFSHLNSENSQGEYVVSILNNVNASENITITDGECQTITFKVLEGAEGENLEIKLSEIQIKTGENKEIISEQTTSVKVISETENQNGTDGAGAEDDQGKTDGAGGTGKEETDTEKNTDPEKDPTTSDEKLKEAGLEDYTFRNDSCSNGNSSYIICKIQKI